MLDEELGAAQGIVLMRHRSGVFALVAMLAGACTPPKDPAPVAPETAFASPLADATFVGSEQCARCHPQPSQEWSLSSHATTVRGKTIDDEDLLNTLVQCSGSDFTHVMGNRHHVRFLVQTEAQAWGAGRILALPCGWNLHERAATLHHETDWRELPWESSCAACHVTGFRASDHGFLELGVGCEECHGPGSRHVAAPSRETILSFSGRTAAEEVTVCASCHLQDGHSKRTGLKFPDGFVPGGSLFDDYAFDFRSMTEEAKSRALDAHQKILVERVVYQGDATLACTSCHDLHGLGHERHEKLPRQEFCSTCHEPDMKLKEYSQSCNVCEF